MITSLGFDTVTVHTNNLNKNISDIFDLLCPLGIKNYIFLFDYDPSIDAISLYKARFNEFKKICTNTLSHRVKIKCAFNMYISNGSAFNPSLDQIYANRSSKILFLSLPLFADTNYQEISLDINHLLYKKSTLPILTNFDKILDTSDFEFCSKFIHNYRFGFSIDLNYLLDPCKKDIFKAFLESKSLILPSISPNTSNYAGIKASAEHIIDLYGKKRYYLLCSQINKCSSKI